MNHESNTNDDNMTITTTSTTTTTTTTTTTQAWAVMEGMMGDLAKARELVLDGLRIDPYHGALWTVYAIIERQDGSHAKARKVCDVLEFACVPWYSALSALVSRGILRCPCGCLMVFCVTRAVRLPPVRGGIEVELGRSGPRARVFAYLEAHVRVSTSVWWLTAPIGSLDSWSNRSCSSVSEPARITAPSTAAGRRWSTSWATRPSPGGGSSRGWRRARHTPACTMRTRTWRPPW